MTNDPILVRLAAANPVPAPPAARRTRAARPRLVAAGAAFAAVLVAAAVAAAGDGLFGFSSDGEPVATASTPFAQATALADAMRDLGFPSTMHLLATRDGIAFYAGRRADGVVCFAVDAGGGKAVGCDLGSPAGAIFPSPQRPIVDFSRFSRGAHLAGFAADGVARVALVDDAGTVVASAPVVDNVYADASPPSGATGVEALDAAGTVVYRRSFDEAP